MDVSIAEIDGVRAGVYGDTRVLCLNAKLSETDIGQGVVAAALPVRFLLGGRAAAETLVRAGFTPASKEDRAQLGNGFAVDGPGTILFAARRRRTADRTRHVDRTAERVAALGEAIDAFARHETGSDVPPLEEGAFGHFVVVNADGTWTLALLHVTGPEHAERLSARVTTAAGVGPGSDGTWTLDTDESRTGVAAMIGKALALRALERARAALGVGTDEATTARRARLAEGKAAWLAARGAAGAPAPSRDDRLAAEAYRTRCAEVLPSGLVVGHHLYQADVSVPTDEPRVVVTFPAGFGLADAFATHLVARGVLRPEDADLPADGHAVLRLAPLADPETVLLALSDGAYKARWTVMEEARKRVSAMRGGVFPPPRRVVWIDGAPYWIRRLTPNPDDAASARLVLRPLSQREAQRVRCAAGLETAPEREVTFNRDAYGMAAGFVTWEDLVGAEDDADEAYEAAWGDGSDAADDRREAA